MSNKQVENLLKGKAAANTEAVKVVIRCRPLSAKEMQANNEVVVQMKTATGEIFVNKPTADEPPKQFTFDEAFDWNLSQAEIYQRCAAHIIENVLEGYNGTIFAYGQTGSGKTHTITGGAEKYSDRGIIARMLSMLFREFKECTDTQFSVHISYLEIYNNDGCVASRRRDACGGDVPKIRQCCLHL